MSRPLELAVAHLRSINSSYYLDLKLLTAGIADACARIEALENFQAKELSVPSQPPVK